VTGFFARLADRATGRPATVRVRVPHPFERSRPALRAREAPDVASAVAHALAEVPAAAGRRPGRRGSPAAARAVGPGSGPRDTGPSSSLGPDTHGVGRHGSGTPRPQPRADRAEPAPYGTGWSLAAAYPDRTRPHPPPEDGRAATAADSHRPRPPGRRPDPAASRARPARPAEPPTAHVTAAEEPVDVSGPGTAPGLTELVRRQVLSALTTRGLAGDGGLLVETPPGGADDVAAAQALAAVPPGTPPGTAVVGVSAARRESASERPTPRRRGSDLHVRVDRVVVVRTSPGPPARTAPPPVALPPARTIPSVDHSAYLARRREAR
jgi:hypothetical protein